MHRTPKGDNNPCELTIPRLELCAARLLTDKVTRVIKVLEIKVGRVILWFDSQKVLNWLQFMSPTTPIFIQNRMNQRRE